MTSNEAASNLPPLPPSSEYLASPAPDALDLQSQVTSLNAKLVKSFEQIGDLEDALERRTHAAAQLEAQVKELQAESKRWNDSVSEGVFVERAHVQSEMQRMMDKVVEETASRGKAESDKATIERELADLTSSLFAEANKMVAEERAKRQQAELSMQHMSDRLNDTETLMAAQAQRLKDIMENADISNSSLFIDTRTNMSSDSLVSHDLTPPLIYDIQPYREFANFKSYIRHVARYAGLTGQGRHMQSPALLEASATTDLVISQMLSLPFIKRCIEEDHDPTLRLEQAPALSFFTRRQTSTAVIEGTILIEPAFGSLPSDKCALCGCNLDTFGQSLEIEEKPSSKGFSKLLMGNLPGLGLSSAQPKQSTTTPASTRPSSPTRANHSSAIYIYRLTDNSSTRYALCSSYCLPRLRSACELWTYIRLMLDTARKTAIRPRASLHTTGMSPRTHDRISPVKATPMSSSLSLTSTPPPAKSELPADIPQVETPSSNSDADTKVSSSDEQPEQPKEKDFADTSNQQIVQDAQHSQPQDTADEPSMLTSPATITSPANLTSPSLALSPASATSGVSPTSTKPPPLPKRSVARNSPTLPRAPSLFPTSPPDGKRPPLPPRSLSVQESSSRPPLQRTASIAASEVGQTEGMEEDAGWVQIVRLKQAMFWTRVGKKGV